MPNFHFVIFLFSCIPLVLTRPLVEVQIKNVGPSMDLATMLRGIRGQMKIPKQDEGGDEGGDEGDGEGEAEAPSPWAGLGQQFRVTLPEWAKFFGATLTGNSSAIASTATKLIPASFNPLLASFIDPIVNGFQIGDPSFTTPTPPPEPPKRKVKTTTTTEPLVIYTLPPVIEYFPPLGQPQEQQISVKPTIPTATFVHVPAAVVKPKPTWPPATFVHVPEIPVAAVVKPKPTWPPTATFVHVPESNLSFINNNINNNGVADPYEPNAEPEEDFKKPVIVKLSY